MLLNICMRSLKIWELHRKGKVIYDLGTKTKTKIILQLILSTVYLHGPTSSFLDLSLDFHLRKPKRKGKNCCLKIMEQYLLIKFCILSGFVTIGINTYNGSKHFL